MRIPLWIHRAERRRRLLALGVSLTEQQTFSTRELDEILAVQQTHQDAENDAQKKQSDSMDGQHKLGGGR